MTAITKTEEIKVKPLPIVPYTVSALGCDPEFFFRDTKTNRIIGSEKVLPKDGITSFYDNGSKIVIDGVQAEMNPVAGGCRDGIGLRIKRLFIEVDKTIKDKKLDITVDLSRSTQITKTELKKLDSNNQRFGCMPSFSYYKGTQTDLSLVDPIKYRHRSAGGHIHIGCGDKWHKDPMDYIMMLDIIVGNTCVLIDRDKGNVRRRKLYGRAGEYRLPKHGIEYRTLSNFWLTHYNLLSFAFGMVRFVDSIMACSDKQLYVDAFKAAVNIDNIQKAINTNNYKLAMKNFKAIEPLLRQVLPVNTSQYGLCVDTIDDFLFFAESVKEHGLKHWFKEDPFQYWLSMSYLGAGAYNFLTGAVRTERLALTENKKVV